jgi:hypothetical protein
MDFITTFFLYLVVTLACKKILDLVLAWKSGLKVYLLPLGPSCPLQTILLSDLVGCDSPLQKDMAVWHTFLKFEAHRTTIIVSSGLPHPTQPVQILKKLCQTVITISAAGCNTRLDGQHCPPRT